MLARLLVGVPLVDLRLQRVAMGQQCGLTRGQCANHVGKPGPERVGTHAGAGQGLLYERMHYGRDP